MRRWLFSLLVLPSLFAACAGADSAKYRVAVIIPMSGQIASLGQYVKNGIDLALEELPAQQRNRIELFYDDDQFSPVNTISAYQKHKSEGRVDAVFVVGSPPANGVGPLTEKDKVLLMAIGASDPTIAVGKEYSFIHWVIPPVLAKKLVDEALRRKLERLALVVAEATGAIADADAVEAELKSRHLEGMIVSRQDFPRENTDYRSALLQIKQKQADGIVTVLFAGALASFAKQFRESQAPAQLIGMETFEDEAEVKAANGALLDTWYVNAADSTGVFVSNYKRRFNTYPGWGASNGYDSLRLIAAALDQVGPDNAKVRDFLRNVKDYSGASGKYSASGDNRFTLPAALKRVTATGFEAF